MKLSTIEVTGDIKVDKKELNGDVLTKSPKLSGNVSKVLDFKSAEWGSITGTLSNQTDLNDALTSIESNQSQMQLTLEKISGINISGIAEKYPIVSMVNDIVDQSGIKWLLIKLNDGTVDGYDIYLPNNHGMQTIRQMIVDAIPTDTSQLTNGAGYTTNTGTLTAVNMNNEDVAVADGRAYLGSVVTQKEVDFVTITLDGSNDFQTGTSDVSYNSVMADVVSNNRIPVAVCPLEFLDANEVLHTLILVAPMKMIDDELGKAVFIYENLDDDKMYDLAYGDPFNLSIYRTKIKKIVITLTNLYNVTAEITEEIAMDTYDIDEAIGDE